jgi:hypothetical protein
MRIHLFGVVLVTAVVSARGHAASPAAPTTQLSIDRVDLMPNRPQPFTQKDFKAIARGLDKLLFDFDARGEYLPLIWWDDTQTNLPMRGFGFPSYVGRHDQNSGATHESITTMGALLGATLAGIDKSREPLGHNWVQMAQVYWNTKNGENVVLNNPVQETGQTYWYETFPQILFNCLVDRYPDTPRAPEIMRTAADRWYAAYEALAARSGGLNFDHTGFSLKKMEPNDNGRWREPDGAEGMAWILFSAYKKFGDEKYLTAAKRLIACTDQRDTNPHYEINHLYGTYLAARLNAQHDTNYDVGRFVNWCFNPSESRPGWGVAVGRWGEYECSGIAAGVNISGGYGFVMNTYVLGGNLVPLVRYDERYARAVGKWMLNATNTVRLCYPDELPADMQSSPGWQSDPPNVIAYEGLIHQGPNGKRPYAQGDAIKGKWGKTDLGIYGSGFVGMFASIVTPTNEEMIPQLDLLACDFWRDQAYPSFLYYNPHEQRREVRVNVGESPVDLYDAVRNDFIARGVSGSTRVAIEPDSAVVLVLAPAGGAASTKGRKTLVNDVVIDFDNGLAPRPEPAPRKDVDDQSQLVAADRATVVVDGDATDWKRLKSQPIKLDTGGRGKLEAEVRFAWDNSYLYVLAGQVAKGEKVQEATAADAYAAAPWEFDGVWLHIDIANGRVATVGDFVVGLAFSSAQASGLHSAPVERAAIASATSGSAESGNRVIEARVPWSAVLKFASNDRPELAKRLGAIAPGFRFGCEPMLVEFNHTRQSFVGGAQHAKPIGRDANSRDIILRDNR